MRTKFNFILTLLMLCFIQINAQDFAYKKHTWEKNPVIHQLTAEEKENNYTYLKEKIMYEFAYEASGELIVYETKHVIIHFNNEKGIEQMNKIYIPYARIVEEIDLKARTITSAGKVIPLSRSSVKKVDDVENSGSYLIFAMEGVDNGGEIEYMYTNKKTANIYGTWTLQDDMVIKDVSVDIYSPDNLIFEGKGYNGFPAFVKDTTIKDKNHIYSHIDKIDALYDEKYNAYDANKMRFEYLLAYNTGNGSGRIYTWDKMGLGLYNSLFVFTKPELKAVEKLISKLQINSLNSDEAKIRALEMFMKNNINNKEAVGDNFTIDKMLELKYGDETNFQKFYVASAQILNIPVEVVITSNRMKRKFDGDFATWSSLQEFLVYYPSIGSYLSSTNYYSRLGFPAPEFTGNKGLFIKETVVGDIKAAVSKVKMINPPEVNKSYNNLTSSVVFDPNTFTPVITTKQEFVGYCAYYTQPTIPYLDDNQKKEFLENMTQFIGKGIIVKSSKMTGGEPKDILVNPLVIDCVVEAPQLIENAANKYIFKVGELIGPQEEMYQEKKRQTDAEPYYTHSYTRLLEIKIPSGYQIKNLKDIVIDKKFDSNGKALATFVSEYKLEGDVLKIKVFEEYQVLFYPKDNFEQYRSVINAAADFNKVVLILEKI